MKIVKMGNIPMQIWSGLQVASSIVGLTRSIFGFDTPSTCDLDTKLDKVFSELHEIINKINNVGLLVSCTQIKQN